MEGSWSFSLNPAHEALLIAEVQRAACRGQLLADGPRDGTSLATPKTKAVFPLRSSIRTPSIGVAGHTGL